MNVPPSEVPGIGTVHAAGTGTEDFLRLLGSADWTSGGSANEFGAAHLILGGLVDKEYQRGGTIENRWGGGFEAVTFASDTGRLQKVGDVLHTFWAVDTRSPDKAQFKPMFYKTTYWQDALIVRYARFDTPSEGIFKLATNSLEVIPPLLKDANEYNLEELGSVDFSHKVLCCHVSVEGPDRRVVMNFMQAAKVGTVELEVRPDSSGRLTIPGDLSTNIIQTAVRGIAGSQPRSAKSR